MFREFDLFNQPVKLNYKGSDRFTTNAGFFFTVCVVVITLIQAVLTFKSISSFESPQVTIERSILTIPNPTNFTETGFVFAIKMPDLTLDSTLVFLEMDHYAAIQHDNGTVEQVLTPIPFKPCTLEYMKDFKDEFVNLGLDQALCPDSATDLQISGTYHNAISESILLTVNSCKNDTKRAPGVVCKSKEEISSYFASNPLEASFVEVFFSNTIISPTHSESVSYYMDSFYWYLLPGYLTVDSEIYLNQQEIISDDNLLFENWNPKNHTTYNIDPAEIKTFSRALLSFNDFESYNIINVWLWKSRSKFTTRRLYPKLQQGLANIGSVFSLCLMVFGVLVRMYAQRAYPIHFASQFYDFDFGNQKKGAVNKKGSSKKDKKAQGPAINKERNRIDASTSVESPRSRSKKKPNIDIGSASSRLLDEKPKITYNIGTFLLSFIPCLRRKRIFLSRRQSKQLGKSSI